MRIRTQLILASFVLAVVPLAAIVTYSYHSSRRALESVYTREANQLTQQMDRRLASIRTELDRRLTFASALPVTDPSTGEVGSGIAAAMGDVTSMVEALEFKPVENPRPAVVATVQVAQADAKTTAADEAEPAEPKEPAAVPPPPAHALMPHPAPAPMVIELPDAPILPRYGMSEKQRELLDEIGELGKKLNDPQLDQDERADLAAEMEAAQKELRGAVSADTVRYRAQVDAVRHQRHAIEEARRVARLMRRTTVAPVPNAAETPKASTTPAVAAVASPAQQPAPNAQPKPAAAKPAMRTQTAREAESSKANEKKTALILGKNFKAPVRQEGEIVGQLSPRINPEIVLRRVLGSSVDGNEVPFAVDKEGTLYTRNPEEKSTIEKLDIVPRVRAGLSLRGIPGWIVSTSTDEQSGLKFGVARPVGDNFQELQRTAARNFALGLGLIVFALIGIVPLSNHLTRDVKLVTDGAERIAHGDLMTRLPVKTKNELGQLAKAFNRMAEDLSHQQQKLLEQERARKEQELHQRLMAVEYERKTTELEEARRFQLSMLPKEVPHHELYDIAVYTRTATEVGGDYYDFHLGDRNALSVTIGDATGHGAKAGTMVTVVKTLFAGYGAESPAHFLGGAAEKIKRMELGRMSMALSVGRLDGHRLTLASAGMPPVFVHHATTNATEEIALEATPLGTLGVEYDEVSRELASGDTVLFMSDGFPELLNDAGQQLGYTAALDAFAAAAARAESADGVIAALAQSAREWHGDAPPNDDVTFVVVRVA